MDRRHEVRMLLQSLQDEETGLASAALFFDRVQQAMHLGARENLTVAVAVIEFAGESGGDLSLMEWINHTAAFVESARGDLRASDAVGVIGRTQVGVLLASVQPPFLPDILERLLLEQRVSVDRDGMSFHIPAKAGIAIAEADDDCPELMQRAWDDLAQRADEAAA